MFKMQANESVTSWFDRYTTIVNQLNQLGRVIPEDEMVKRLLRNLSKSWRSTVVAIREAKDLNKISRGVHNSAETELTDQTELIRLIRSVIN